MCSTKAIRRVVLNCPENVQKRCPINHTSNLASEPHASESKRRGATCESEAKSATHLKPYR